MKSRSAKVRGKTSTRGGKKRSHTSSSSSHTHVLAASMSSGVTRSSNSTTVQKVRVSAQSTSVITKQSNSSPSIARKRIISSSSQSAPLLTQSAMIHTQQPSHISQHMAVPSDNTPSSPMISTMVSPTKHTRVVFTKPMSSGAIAYRMPITSPFTSSMASYSTTASIAQPAPAFMAAHLKKGVNVPGNQRFRVKRMESPVTIPRASFRATNVTRERKRDYYEVLGVKKTDDADTIKKAYFALAKKYHPDTSKEPDAQKKFAEISSAYEVLRDDEKRQQYDQFGHDAEQFEQAGYGPGPGFNPEDLIREMFFGGKMGGMGFDFAFDMGHPGQSARSSRPRQGNDVQAEVTLTFMEAVEGCSKYINVKTLHPCTPCRGEGTKQGAKITTCQKCHGTGAQRIMKGMFHIETTCGDCAGTGKSVPTCTSCHGDTVVPETRRVTVNIPSGVDSTTNLRLVNQGDAGYKNGPRGHLWVKLKILEDDRFKRDGSDVHITIPLTLPQAVLGCMVDVPTLSGTATLRVPPGTQPTDNQIMRNKGIKLVNRNQFGHQYIHFRMDVPRMLTPRARELMEQFAIEMKMTDGINLTSTSSRNSSRNIYGASSGASGSQNAYSEGLHPDAPYTPPPRPSSSSSTSTDSSDKPSEGGSQANNDKESDGSGSEDDQTGGGKRKKSLFGKLKNVLGKDAQDDSNTTKH